MKQENLSDGISITYQSGIYILTVEQQLNISINEAWEFFSNPANLSKITPPEMKFNITSGNPGKMFAGQIIAYKINVLPRIKSNWVTEITQVNHNKYFIDEQRFGPYKMWHHEHHFQENKTGVLMKDKVSYKIPMGFCGRILHELVIRKKLKQIFSYRVKKLEEIFENH